MSQTPPPAGPPVGPPAGPPVGPPPGPPPAHLALTVQGSVMTSNMITPQVRLNGYQVPVSYGMNLIPVPPGRYRVEVHAQWLRRYGQAELDVALHPGQTVPVFYAAPLHQFSRGAIGHEKQPRRGKGAFVALMLVLLLLAVGIVALNLA